MGGEIKDWAIDLYSLSIQSIKSIHADNRIGGLKLIGALICDPFISSLLFDEHPMNVREISNLLQSIVNLDNNKDVRLLAEKILINSFSH